MSLLTHLLPHFSLTVAWLPSPLWFTTVGTMLIIAGGAVLWFLKAVQTGLEIAAVGLLLLLCATVANTYEARGEAIVQAQFDAFKAAQAKLAADIAAQQATALAKANADAQAAIAAEKGRSDVLSKQVAALQHRNVVLSGALSDVLQHSGSDATSGDAGTQPGGQRAAVAIPTSPAPQSYDEQQLGQFFAAARAAYDSAHDAWQACVNDYEAIRAPTLNQPARSPP